jgi:hypothetical protein
MKNFVKGWLRKIGFGYGPLFSELRFLLFFLFPFSSGVYSIMDGAREGEKPYYVDSETGERLPPDNQDGSSGIGVGTSF